MFAGLDLTGDDVGERLFNRSARSSAGTAACSPDIKLIDGDDPMQSALRKRVTDEDCGPKMPIGLSPDDRACLEGWLAKFASAPD
jgi:hypothetical protein